jgi:DNA (cytosine-5)-methyltransferase 1
VPEGGNPTTIVEPDMRAWLDQMYSNSLSQRFIYRLHRARAVPCDLTDVDIRGVLHHCHPFHNRTSTVREMARFQDFPDEFIFPASLDDAYRMIGEAVPVGMGLAWARQIMRALGGAFRLHESGILLPSRPDLADEYVFRGGGVA